VTRRVRSRTASAAVVAASFTALLAVLGWLAPGWFVGSAGAVIGGGAVAVCVAGVTVLAGRCARWSQAAELAGLLAASVPGAAPPGVPARCGTPVRLHQPRTGLQRWSRPRLPAHLVPIRAAGGPLAAGHAVVVHPRPDALLLDPEDSIEVHALGRRGPFLIVRTADRAVFAADRWVFSLA